MAQKIHRLNAKQADAIMKPGRHADGQNLFLSVSESGRRRWVFLYRWQGGRAELGLGSARDISLASARESAHRARELLRKVSTQGLFGSRALKNKQQQRRPRSALSPMI